MKKPSNSDKKAYAMRRMAIAIDNTNAAPTHAGKNRASRWVAAWGLVYHGQQSQYTLQGTESRTAQGLQNTRTWMALVC
jgi:hypothetical protein